MKLIIYNIEENDQIQDILDRNGYEWILEEDEEDEEKRIQSNNIF